MSGRGFTQQHQRHPASLSSALSLHIRIPLPCSSVSMPTAQVTGDAGAVEMHSDDSVCVLTFACKAAFRCGIFTDHLGGPEEQSIGSFACVSV